MNPLVYVAVLNYNGERWLKRCLESLLASTYSPSKLLLVDNGSSDKSVALARSISSRIDILENRANLDFVTGNNAAIGYALERGARYIALLNNDTYVEPDWLARIIEVGESTRQLGILGPVQLVFDGQELNSWMTGALAASLETIRSRDQPGAWVPVEWVEGSGLVAKREVFERIGRLDPIFSFFFEECDLCRRARLAGFQIGIVPSSKIHHHRGGSFAGAQLARSRAFLLVRNSMIYDATDPQASLFVNMIRLSRNSATHLKEALFGEGSLAIWGKATCTVAARLPALYRKWCTDRERIRADGTAFIPR